MLRRAPDKNCLATRDDFIHDRTSYRDEWTTHTWLSRNFTKADQVDDQDKVLGARSSSTGQRCTNVSSLTSHCRLGQASTGATLLTQHSIFNTSAPPTKAVNNTDFSCLAVSNSGALISGKAPKHRQSKAPFPLVLRFETSLNVYQLPHSSQIVRKYDCAR